MDFLTQHMNSIILGDCLDVMKQMPDKCVDLVLTDPPYGMSFQSGYRKIKYAHIENDNSLNWLPDWLSEVNRVRRPESHLYIFCSWHNVDVFKRLAEQYFNIKNILIWMKNNTGMGDLINDYAPQYEMILYVNPQNKPLNMGRDSNILKFARTQNARHPTEKPVDLFKTLILKSSTNNDLVFDPFSGFGTTAVACHKLNRRFICVEKNPDYWQASVQRLENERKQIGMPFDFTASADEMGAAPDR